MNLQYRQSKIQEKRKKTPWREFVMEIASWYQVSFYKNQGQVSRYPESNRIGRLLPSGEFYESMLQQPISREYVSSVFQTITDLFHDVSLPSLRHWDLCENSGFSDTCYRAKNCYLSTCVCFDVENIVYSHHVAGNCSHVYNSVFVASNSQNVYTSSNVINSFDIFFSHGIESSSFLWYCNNCIGCSECIGCNNLTNASYMIENISYSKQTYLQKKQDIIEQYHRRGVTTKDVSVASVFRCDNVQQALFCADVHNGRNIIMASRDDSGNKTNLYDVMSTGGTIDNAYGCMGVSPGDNFYCCINCATCSHVYYSIFLGDCSFCFGCIGLRNKSYCIYNKQYAKEERYEKVDEIFEQMDGTPDPSNPPQPSFIKEGGIQRGESLLGTFFPATMNPFYFNDTAAYLIDPSFTKEEVTAKGYLRRDEPLKVDVPEGAKIVLSKDLGQFEGRKEIETKGTKGENGTKPTFVSFDSSGYLGNPDRYVWHIDPEILKYVIQDEEGNYYRIIPIEYKFLMKHGLPLPRKHWLERMKENFRINYFS